MATLTTCTSSSRPGSPSTGDMLYETDTYRTIIWDGSAWHEFQPTNAPYVLDGSNTLDVTPIIHLDAGKINGVDTSGNPSDGGDVTNWKSLVGDNALEVRGSCSAGTNINNKHICATAGGSWTATTTNTPVWNDGTGAGAKNSKPYVHFSSDELVFKHEMHLMGGYFLVMVVTGTAAASEVGTFSHFSGVYYSGVHQVYTGGWNGVAGLVQRGGSSALTNYYANHTPNNYRSMNWGGAGGNVGTGMSLLVIDRLNMSVGMTAYQDGNNAYPLLSYGKQCETWHSYGYARTQPYDCYLSEAIGFSTDNNLSTESHRVTDANKNKILSYLDTKYGLTTTDW